MKRIFAFLIMLGLLAVTVTSFAQEQQYKTLVVAGTADTIIDSTSLPVAVMSNKRAYINGIYFWYDNGANTNQLFVEVIRGGNALVTQGSGRQFKYSEAMTSAGIKGVALTPNITTDADSGLYFVIAAASSDSLFMAVNYKLINK